MALSTRHRASLYTTLSPIVGEEAINAMLAEFPASDHDRLVTESFLRAELAELRVDLRGEMAVMRDELRGEVGELRGDVGELRGEVGELRREITGVRGEVSGLRAELHADIVRSANRVLLGMGGTLIAGMGLAAAIGRGFG